VRKRTVFTWAADFTQALTAEQPEAVTAFPPAATPAGDRS